MRVESTWNVDVASEAAWSYAYGRVSRRARFFSFWLVFLAVAMTILVMNDFGNSILKIGAVNLSVLSDVVLCLFLVAVAYGATLLIAYLGKNAWRRSVIGQLQPWPSTGDGVRIYETNAEGISITTPTSTHTYAWSSISGFENIGGFLFILAGPKIIGAIPHDSFTDNPEINRFMAERLQ